MCGQPVYVYALIIATYPSRKGLAARGQKKTKVEHTEPDFLPIHTVSVRGTLGSNFYMQFSAAAQKIIHPPFAHPSISQVHHFTSSSSSSLLIRIQSLNLPARVRRKRERKGGDAPNNSSVLRRPPKGGANFDFSITAGAEQEAKRMGRRRCQRRPRIAGLCYIALSWTDGVLFLLVLA